MSEPEVAAKPQDVHGSALDDACSGLREIEDFRRSMEESLSGLARAQAGVMTALASLQEDPLGRTCSNVKLNVEFTKSIGSPGPADNDVVLNHPAGTTLMTACMIQEQPLTPIKRKTAACSTPLPNMNRRIDNQESMFQLVTHGARQNKRTRRVSGRILRERPVHLREEFAAKNATSDQDSTPTRAMRGLRNMGTDATIGTSADLSQMSTSDAQSSPWGIMVPHSWLRICLDFLSVVVLTYDLWVIPLVMAWDIELKGWILYSAWASLSFWTFDLFASFRTAVYVRGTLLTAPNEIAKEYLKTRFVADLAIVCADWLSTNLELASSASSGNQVKMLRFLKIGRALRLTGIMKVRRFNEVLERVLERRFLDYMDLGPAVFKVFLLILWTNHVISCCWYALGSMVSAEDTDTGLRWTDTDFDPLNQNTYLSHHIYAYVSAFHWSLCQMTPGSLQIHSVNTVERIFSILCLLLGMVFFSSLISSISAKLTERRISKEKNSRMMDTLRQYFRQHKVDGPVVMGVHMQLQARMHQHPPLVEKDVPALSLLSTRLRMAVFREVYGRHLVRWPLWRWCSEWAPEVFQALCHRAVESVILKPHDVLFDAGTPATHAYIVASSRSTLHFFQLADEFLGDPIMTEVKTGAALSLAALWVKWTTTGTVLAKKSCELISIDATEMIEVVWGNKMVCAVFADYARAFHAAIEAAARVGMDTLTDLGVLSARATDLGVPLTNFEDLLPGMSSTSRHVIGMMACESLRQRLFRSPWVSIKMVVSLQEEVDNGRALLMLDSSGEVLRIINVVALRVVSERDGMVLMQLAKVDKTTNKVSPAALLPGTKQRPGEASRDALERLLSKELSPLASFIRLEDFEISSESRVSRRTGTSTLYKRCVHIARFPQDCEPLGVAAVALHGMEEHLPRQMRDVFLLADCNANLSLYAWVQPAFLEQCKSSERMLMPYLNALRVTEEDTQRALDLLATNECRCHQLIDTETPGSLLL